MKKRSFLVCKYFIICLAISTFIQIPVLNVRANPTSRYYAGYDYRGASGEGPWGVKADVFTIWPYIPAPNTLFEFVAVMVSYSPNYWIQLGFKKYTILWLPVIDFYVEIVDMLVPRVRIHYGEKPLKDHTYTYAIWWDTAVNSWWWMVLEGSRVVWHGHDLTYPDDPVDIQARVETTNPNINIDWSHYSQMCYTPEDISGWYLWNEEPVVRENEWYYVIEKSYYEFYAFKY